MKNSKVIFLVMYIYATSCAPPKVFMDNPGQSPMKKMINSLIVDSGLDVNMSIKVTSLNSGEILYALNSQKRLMPASNNKLYTCAAALANLGSDTIFETAIYQQGNNLILKGGGDPDFSLEQLDSLAQIISSQIESVDTLFVDESLMDTLHYGVGWMWDEGSWWYAAQISALSINENCVDFYVTPGITGQPVLIQTNPVTDFISITNQSKTVNDTTNFKELKIERDWKKQTNSFTITGNVMDTASTDTFQRNVHDPTLYSGTVFAEMLQTRGININHVIKAPLSPGAIKVTEHRSKPVNHALTEFMKRSENLTAELLVKHIGAVFYDTVGTWNNGLLAIKLFLHDTVGIDTNTFRLSDGSGVSRYNYSSPEHFIKLLTWAYNNKPVRDKFLNTIPIGGWDGTLEDRMQNEESVAKIIAKTGTLSGVSCLSGYIFTTRGDPLAFSILMNGYVNEAKPFRNLQDRIVNALTEIKL